MKIVVIKEIREGEKRVALTPDGVKSLTKAGYECHIESGAGDGSFISDDQYRNAGAHISTSKEDLLSAGDVFIKVNPPFADEIAKMKEGLFKCRVGTSLDEKKSICFFYGCGTQNHKSTKNGRPEFTGKSRRI